MAPVMLRSYHPAIQAAPTCMVMSQVMMLLEKGSRLEVKFPVLLLTRQVTYPCQSFEVSEQPVSSGRDGE